MPLRVIDPTKVDTIKQRNGDQAVMPGPMGQLLRRADSHMYGRLQKVLLQRQVTPGDFGVLWLVHENEGLSQSELGKAIHADRSTIVALVDRFEERGLLLRTPSPFDRRSHALRLTETGQKLLTELIPLIEEHEHSLLAKLSADEQTQLTALLTKLIGE